MTRRDITRLFIRVFGLLILPSTAAGLPSTIYGFELQMRAWVAARVVYDLPSLLRAIAYQFGPTAIYAALGLGFMWCSGRIVDRTSQAPQEDSLPVAPADLKNIEVSLVAVIGLYFLADGSSEFCRFAFSQGFTRSLDGSTALKSIWTSVTGYEIALFLQIMVKLAIGVALVLGRGATIAALHRSRRWVQTWRAWPYPPEEDRAH